MLLLPDGKFLRFFGAETFVEQPGSPLTRYFADGALDPSFNFNSGYRSVSAAVALPDGKLIVSAARNVYNQQVEEIIRLHPNGSIDTTFSATRSTAVRGLTVQIDGKILAAGSFTSFGTDSSRPGIVRLLADGGVDSSFAPVPLLATTTSRSAVGTLSANDPVLQLDGKIIIYGNFRRIRHPQLQDEFFSFPAGVARLNPDGTVDTSFQPSGFTRQVTVRSALVQPDGKILLGGRFFIGNPTGPTAPIVRLNTDGTLDPSYAARSGAIWIRDMALQPDGGVIATATQFARGTVLRFGPNGPIESDFHSPRFADPSSSESISLQPLFVALQANRQILVSGLFSDVDATSITRSNFGIVRLNADGSVDRSLTTPLQTGRATYPRSVARLSDGATYVGFGSFGSLGDTAVPNNFARLRADGSLDAGFNPFANRDPEAPVNSGFISFGFTRLADEKFFVYGSNQPFGRFFYDRLLADGSHDPAFSPAEYMLTGVAADDITAWPHDSNAVLLSCSSPQCAVDGTVVHRIDASGSIDTSFQLQPYFAAILVRRDANNVPEVIFAGARIVGVLPDGKMLFVYLHPDLEARLVRLNANGSIDGTFGEQRLEPLQVSHTFPVVTDPSRPAAFQPSGGAYSGDTVLDVEVQSDGKIIIVGSFRSINGVPSRGIARLNPDGGLDQSFGTGDGPTWTATAETPVDRPVVEQIEPLSGGKLLVAGTFEAFSGVTAPGLAVLRQDGSVDASFVAPAVRRKELGGRCVLARQPDGSLLLSGPYSYMDDTAAPSLIRLAPLGGLLNVSTRLAVGTGENVLIGGFIVDGNAPKKVIIRAIGPSLSAAGTAGTLQDPRLQLLQGQTVLKSNDDWRSTQEQEIIATTIPPKDNREAAIVATLNPGAYTALVSGKDGTTGIAVVELYDLGTASADAGAEARLANISTRGKVGTNDDVMIGGFIVSGPTAKLIIRGIGPSLAQGGVTGALQDPTLDLIDGNGSVVMANDDWRTGGGEQEIKDTGVPPGNDRESAIVSTVAPGAYTAVLRGKENTTGVALVEVYALN